MRSLLRTTHKYLGLTFGLLWLLQAVSGVILTFRGELDDALLAGPSQPLAAAPFGASVTALMAADNQVQLGYIMVSEGSPNRYDLLFNDKDDRTRVVRVDGIGTVLRERPQNYDYPAPGTFQIALDFHETLFAGDRGAWFLGLSGTLLLSNLLLGLKLAWRARGQPWSRVLKPGFAGTVGANVYKWHRALGLYLVPFALITVACGVLQEWPPDNLLGVESPTPGAHASAQTNLVPLGDALGTALARYPNAAFALVEMPNKENPWYRIRLRQPGELRRVFGVTTIYIDVHDGSVLLDRDAFKLPLNEKIANAIYPIHTGEFAGLFGRILVLLIGLWLIAMTCLGASLWWTRQRARAVSTTNKLTARTQR